MSKIESHRAVVRRARRAKEFFKSPCCNADVVLGSERQWWCTGCFEDVPEPQRPKESTKFYAPTLVEVTQAGYVVRDALGPICAMLGGINAAELVRAHSVAIAIEAIAEKEQP